MDRLRAVGALLLLAAIYFAGLRALHLTVPLFYPRALRGPFVVEQLEEAESFTGYSALTPFYRPERLGTRPVSITVTRPPEARVVVYWQGDRFLYLSQQLGGEQEVRRFDRRAFPGHPETLWWQEGTTHHLQLRRGELWIELRTDLPEEDVGRILETLRPVEDLL